MEKGKHLGTILKKAIQNKLAFYRDRVKEKNNTQVKDEVDSLVKLFSENKIASFETVENVLGDLTSKRKETVAMGEKKKSFSESV